MHPSPYPRPARPGFSLTRRDLLRAAGALGSLGILTGCSTGGDRPEPVAAGAVRRIEHLRGVTEIQGSPQRVVTVGYSDQDPVLALGVRPVGVTDWYGDQPYAVWPWAQAALGDAKPAVLNKGAFTGTPDYQYEQIAALAPDLILGLYTQMSQTEYDRLSTIAPTVAPPMGFPEFAAP
ncbi:MAG: ABC transporter substrate-binding protein, partial [Propionibacteriales bacterium]|nr:ABC transporter substrate-binding protein [Propionibacteriales bacterium]